LTLRRQLHGALYRCAGARGALPSVNRVTRCSWANGVPPAAGYGSRG